MSLTIVPMTTKDLEVVAHIEENAFEQPWSPHSFRTELIKNDLAYYMVARLKEKVVGYGGIWVIFNEAHLTTLAVDEPYRRCGVGAALAPDDQIGRVGAAISLEVQPAIAPLAPCTKIWFKARGSQRLLHR